MKSRSFFVAIISVFSLFTSTSLYAQSRVDPRLDWWRDARFGMFIHWGPVTLKGTEIGWSRGKTVPSEEYDQLYRKFDPKKFSAKEWVRIAKDAGMKYIVLTAKHHDGFCMWDTKTTDYNIMNTPFGRDVVKELAEECKKQGIVFCTYYSVLDWYHPDYNTNNTHGGPGYKLPPGQKPDMERYVTYMYSQLKELVENYGPLGIMWFDGEWEKPWTHERGLALYKYVRSLQDDIIINNRVDKGRAGMAGTTKTDLDYAGDYDTPEQEIGKFQTERPWESCITISKQWAWKPDDKMKSLDELIRTLVLTTGGDGNLLLNVGPRPDGRIEPDQEERLRELGQWLKENGESIYGTHGGPYRPGDWGVSTWKDNKIYLHILDNKTQKLKLPSPGRKVIKCHKLHGGDIPFSLKNDKVSLDLTALKREGVDTIVVMEVGE